MQPVAPGASVDLLTMPAAAPASGVDFAALVALFAPPAGAPPTIDPATMPIAPVGALASGPPVPVSQMPTPAVLVTASPMPLFPVSATPIPAMPAANTPSPIAPAANTPLPIAPAANTPLPIAPTPATSVPPPIGLAAPLVPAPVDPVTTGQPSAVPPCSAGQDEPADAATASQLPPIDLMTQIAAFVAPLPVPLTNAPMPASRRIASTTTSQLPSTAPITLSPMAPVTTPLSVGTAPLPAFDASPSVADVPQPALPTQAVVVTLNTLRVAQPIVAEQQTTLPVDAVPVPVPLPSATQPTVLAQAAPAVLAQAVVTAPLVQETPPQPVTEDDVPTASTNAPVINATPAPTAPIQHLATPTAARPTATRLIVDQVVRQVAPKLAEGGELKLTLRPDSLGTIDVSIRLRDNTVEVSIAAEGTARDLLQAGVDELRAALQPVESRPVVVDVVTRDAAPTLLGQFDGDGGRRDTPARSTPLRRFDEPADEPIVRDDTPADGRVDYRV